MSEEIFIKSDKKFDLEISTASHHSSQHGPHMDEIWNLLCWSFASESTLWNCKQQIKATETWK